MKLTTRLRFSLPVALLVWVSALLAAPAVRAALPVIYSFDQSGSATINLGQSVTFNWSVSNGASVSLAPGIGPVTGTQVTVTPTQTTTYVLTATNSSGSVTKSKKITVIVPPTVNTLAATPDTVLPGGAATLAWTGTGASYYRVTTDAGANLGNVFGTSLKVYPQTTTTYTVTAVNTAGTGSRSVGVTVVPPGPKPTIDAFAASPTAIFAGQSTTLSWSVTGADTLSISPGIGAVTGSSVTVSPSATTTYTLTAKNLNGSVTKSTTVTVTVAPPTIDSFTAAPSAITAGQSSTLNWSVTGAASLAISPDVGAVTGSSVTVSPSASTTYTLSATNAGGTVTKDVTIAVSQPTPPPIIESFTASSSNITQGQSLTLSWSVSGATTLSLSPSVGVVTGSSVTVVPGVDTTYVLTASNDGGTVTQSVSVTVSAPLPPPVIHSFTATPDTLSGTGNATLAWSVDGATELTILANTGANPGNVLGLSSFTVSPGATTTYTLYAKNATATVTQTATVTVTDPTPASSIDTFVASSYSATAGEAVTLSWTTTNLGSLWLSADAGGDPGSVSGMSSIVVHPQTTTRYTLSGWAGAAGTIAKTLVVNVGAPLTPVVNSFTATPDTIAPGAVTTLAWSVSNADSVSISADVGASPGIVTGSSVTVSPAQTTTYTITAQNGSGSVTKTATVTVVAVASPVISTFTATPATITSGQSSTLAWSVTGADSLSISPTVGAVTGTSVAVSPATTTTYTLTAANASGTVTQTATVTVNTSTGPSIDTFTASSTNVNAGDAVTLTWTTTKMGGLWMSADAGGDPGSVPANGSLVVHPQTTTRYTVSGWNGDTNSTIFKSLTVNVGPPPTPTINSFSASPETIAIGASTTLNWSVANADTVSIAADVGASPGTVTGSSVTVSPTATTTYTLTASLGGVSATRTATVTVTGPTAPNIASFYAQPAFIQSGASTTLTWSVSGADTVSISPGIGEVTGNSVTITPIQTTTYTLSATNGIGTSTRTAIVTLYTPGNGSVQHPRIWVTPASLTALQQRAAANDPAWIRLRNACDAYVTMPVAYPDAGNSSGTISGGYQYYDYMRPSFELSLGYLVAKAVDPDRAARYAAKERELLLALSDPVHHGFSLIDSGWAIRAYVPALAIGYDWIFETLSDSDRAQIFTEINRWVADFETGGFNRGFPQGNYFAGYYAAKALGALATEGENPNGPAMWSDWLNRLHYGMVQPYHQQWLSGGAAPDGWNYGQFETINMVRPLAAAFTAKGLDLIHDAAHPHGYPDGNVKWVTQFTWPDMKTVSDRGLIYDGDNPTGTDAGWATQYTGFLRLANGDNTPIAQRYTLDLRSQQSVSGIEPWADFLLFDAAAPTAAYRTDVSYRTPGTGEVAMRSSWATDAVWASFQAGPHTGYVQSGEEFFDQGALVIQRGGVQFLVNAWGALLRNTPGTSDGGGSVFTNIYNELFDTAVDGVKSGRRLFNTFYAVRPSGYWGQIGNGPDGAATTTLSRFEEGTDYVLARGTKLENQYFDDHPIKGWTRTVVFLRPQLFVVHDRTTVNDANVDNWMAWHVAAAPAEQAAAAGTHRFDVLDTRAAFGGNLFRGRVTTVLPAGHTVSAVNLYNYGKVYRLEVRPGTPAANNTWLTVLDASASAAQAGDVTALTQAAGNLSTDAAEGSLIRNAAGNYAVLFSKSASALAGSFTLRVPADDTYLFVADLAPSTGYTVTATVAAGTITLSLSPGGSVMTTAQGTLKVDVTAAGVVTPL